MFHSDVFQPAVLIDEAMRPLPLVGWVGLAEWNLSGDICGERHPDQDVFGDGDEGIRVAGPRRRSSGQWASIHVHVAA